MYRIITWIAAMVLSSFCISQAESNTRTEKAEEENYYVWTRDDMRMCPSPTCGGVFIKALNHVLTSCADGNVAKDCQVILLDFSLLDMSENEQANFQQAFTEGLGIIKGQLLEVQQDGFLFPTLKVYEAWLAQSGEETAKPAGFFRVHDTGIQCITTPCLTVDEEILNLRWDRSIAGVDLSFTGAEMEQINAGYQEMKTGSIIATGRHVAVRGPAGFSQNLVATEFYLPVGISGNP